jgi:hypothetical protein
VRSRPARHRGGIRDTAGRRTEILRTEILRTEILRTEILRTEILRTGARWRDGVPSG